MSNNTEGDLDINFLNDRPIPENDKEAKQLFRDFMDNHVDGVMATDEAMQDIEFEKNMINKMLALNETGYKITDSWDNRTDNRGYESIAHEVVRVKPDCTRSFYLYKQNI